jgi:outer membrane lipoprotein-sorting protein
MKTVLKAGSLLLLFLFVSGCATRPEKTIENLKYAFNGESTASANMQHLPKKQ